jgi:hypothetical protein
MLEPCELKLRLERESEEGALRYDRLVQLMPKMKAIVTGREYRRMSKRLETLRANAEKARQEAQDHIQSHGCA